jgi:uncharacterized membrane protein YbaN (DUF454 family)
LKKITRICWGFGLIVTGVIGLAVPIMPTWVFVIPGLIILAEHFSWAREALDWGKKQAERYGGEPYRKYVERSNRRQARREASGNQ